MNGQTVIQNINLVSIIIGIVIALIIAFGLIFASNGIWIWYISQYDYSSVSVDLETDSGGDANYIGNDGNIYNGTNPSSEEVQD